MWRYSSSVVFMLFLMSCDEPVIWESSHEFEYDKWYYDLPATFEFEAPDTTQLYSLLLQIQHEEEYSYQNLYARIQTIFPSGDTTTTVTNFDLATKTGRWFGDCRFGLCRPTAELQSRFRFEQPGSYAISVEQHMRINPLQDIPKLTLQLISADSSPK